MADNLIKQIRAKLDSEASEPLYLQIAANLRDLITNGDLRTGDRLPGVADMGAMLGVSKGTALQAVAELRKQHLITARRRGGIHVATAMPAAVEVFSCVKTWDRITDFLDQVGEGLGQAYDDPERRIITTLTHDYQLSGDGLLAAAAARGVDGMVFYRPSETAMAAVAEASRRMPCVTLFNGVKGAMAPCIYIDPTAAVEKLLRTALKRGASHFAYLGQHALLQDSSVGKHSAYIDIYNAALGTLASAGVELTMCLTPGGPVTSPDDMAAREVELVKRAAKLPEDTVIVVQTGTLAARLAQRGRQFDIITYTEYRATLEKCRDEVTVIYGGLELLGAAAARMLQRLADDLKIARKEPEVAIEPLVYPRQS